MNAPHCLYTCPHCKQVSQITPGVTVLILCPFCHVSAHTKWSFPRSRAYMFIIIGILLLLLGSIMVYTAFTHRGGVVWIGSFFLGVVLIAKGVHMLNSEIGEVHDIS